MLNLHQNTASWITAAGGFLLMVAGFSPPLSANCFGVFIVALVLQGMLGRRDYTKAWVRAVTVVLALVQALSMLVPLVLGERADAPSWGLVALGIGVLAVGLQSMVRFNLGLYEWDGPA